MASLVSPYRLGETPLMTRERALEQELVSARQMLDALANEELRVQRGVMLGEIQPRALDEVRSTLRMMIATEHQVARELEWVRAEIVARGERRHIARAPDHAITDGPIWPLWLGALFFAAVVALGLLL